MINAAMLPFSHRYIRLLSFRWASKTVFVEVFVIKDGSSTPLYPTHYEGLFSGTSRTLFTVFEMLSDAGVYAVHEKIKRDKNRSSW